MTQQQIDAGKQIRNGTITSAQISGTAGITDGQLATSYSKADGTRAFTGEVTGVTPTSTSSLATKGYVDTIAQGLDTKPSSRAMTNTETLTIAAGTVTQITGTTVDGVTIAVNDYILIPNAPVSTGAAGGTTFSSQPGNGLYKASAVAANITVGRAPEQSGTENPAGDFTFVEAGSVAGSGYTVTTPSAGSGFAYGTNNIAWTQFSGAGEITVDTSLTKSGNQLGRAALTGDVTASAGSNATTIAAAAVTLAKMANLAANSVIANTTGAPAVPAALGLTAAATASTAVVRDGSANTRVNNLIENFQTVVSAAATTTLAVGSAKVTQITGATTQIVKLPDATTLVIGQQFMVINRSSGNVTVNDNSSTLVQTMVGGAFLVATVTSVGTAAGTWDAAYTSAGGSGSVTTVSVVNANGFNGSVANASTTPAITITTTVTGVLKGNGTAISAATAGTDYYAPGSTDVAIADGGTGTSSLPSGLLKGAGTGAITAAVASTDYLAPASRVTRETPSGTVNGANTVFSLANTPIVGTEEVYLNGLQQEPGAGNDYTISGLTITYLTAPVSGDKIRVSYFK